MFVMSLSLSLILIRFSFLSYDWLFQWPDKLKKKRHNNNNSKTDYVPVPNKTWPFIEKKIWKTK